MTRLNSLRFAAMAIALTLPATAWAEGIQIEKNQAKIVKLARDVDTVVIGEPLIADVTLQDDRTLVLTGKGFGITNLVVLAEDGSPIIDEQVIVSRQSTSSVRVYRRAEVQTLSCTPVCEAAFKGAAEKSSDGEMAASQ